MAGLASDDRPGDRARGAFEEQDRTTDPDGLPADHELSLADRDQAATQREQALSDDDQESADRDQLAADRDQASSDRDLAGGGSPRTHEASRHARERSSDQRENSALTREHSSRARLEAGEQRDAIADDRDIAAMARDLAAEQRERAMAQHDAAAQLDDDEQRSGSERVVRAAGARRRAVMRRAQAAEYRALAALDRQFAALDREQAARERRRALVDREALALLLQRERQRRDDAPVHERPADQPAAQPHRGVSAPSLPQIAGVDVAVHHEPLAAEQVGGDFYDVFSLAGARAAFFVGDVCAKGPHAVAVASLARDTLRAAAMLDDEPEAVLLGLNAALLRDSATAARVCSVVYGEIDVRSRIAAIRLAVAGHLSPLIVRADGAVEPVAAGGTLLGAIMGPAFGTCDVELASGDTMIMHTDGILDATLDRADEPRGAELLRGPPHASAQTLVDRLVHTVRRADRPLRDDVAIIALRRRTLA